MNDLKKDLLPVVLGGALGTALRIILDLVFTLMFISLTLVSTMLINAAGAFLLGVLVAGLWKKPKTPRWLKVAVGPGLLGGFTTFSGVMVQSLMLGNAVATAGYVAASIATSLFAAVLGIWLGTPAKKKRARR